MRQTTQAFGMEGNTARTRPTPDLALKRLVQDT